MPIQFFREAGRGFAPKVSIRAQGQIGLNQGAVARFGIRDDSYVLLGYDAEKKMVAIKLVNEGENGARRVAIRHGGASIPAKSFLDYFDIGYDKARRYDLQEDAAENALVFYIE